MVEGHPLSMHTPSPELPADLMTWVNAACDVDHWVHAGGFVVCAACSLGLASLGLASLRFSGPWSRRSSSSGGVGGDGGSHGPGRRPEAAAVAVMEVEATVMAGLSWVGVGEMFSPLPSQAGATQGHT